MTTTRRPFRFNIPTPTPLFKGRSKTIQDIKNYFTKLPAQSTNYLERIVAIVGLGGMGKTEAALKFAAESKAAFPSVAFIRAETETSVLKSFLHLAKVLEIVPWDITYADLDLVRKVYRHIDQDAYGSVLFIFDNATRLHSDEEGLGIIKYLSTEDFPYQRFPHFLSTTQTNDWDRRIPTFQLNELSEEESIEFFRSGLRIKSHYCDDLLRKLHKLCEGYPLIMNVVASHIDYDPEEDSVHQLKQQIQIYIDKFEKEDNTLLTEKRNVFWPTKYNKTLSNVWQLAFERLEQQDNGPEALDLLKCMSLLRVPLLSNDLVQIILAYGSGNPHLSKRKLELRLKELLLMLERFYILRILNVRWDDENGLDCDIAIHRLMQLVVRQHTDPSKVLDPVLIYFASEFYPKDSVKVSALKELGAAKQPTKPAGDALRKNSCLSWFFCCS